MREIPKLQVLCLRAVGSPTCSAEDTFASNQATGEPSKASQLLRVFHSRRGVVLEDSDPTLPYNDQGVPPSTIDDIPLRRSVFVGPGSSRRANANDIDLNHPLIAHRYEDAWVMEHGSPALDCLQSYIDSLVELGRMADGRLGVHFFQEWKVNVLLAAGQQVPWTKPVAATDDADRPPKRSRRHSSGGGTKSLSIRRTVPTAAGPLGSLSLNNCAIADETVEAMRESGMAPHLGVLDLSGVYGLNDAMLELLLPHCPNLTRLSIKNCRRVTVASLQILARHQTQLQCLDVGGTYNITPDEVVETLIVGNRRPPLLELHASGLGWNDALLEAVVGGDNDHEEEDEEEEEDRPLRPWKALSVGFSISLSALGLRHALSKVAPTLISLALHFCENVVDNALMGMLGRNLPNVRYLDVRGNPSLNSMTGWYDGRASAELDTTTDGEAFTAQELIVLARFTGISKSSAEETLRIHPLEAAKMTCILDGGGHGLGVFR